MKLLACLALGLLALGSRAAAAPARYAPAPCAAPMGALAPRVTCGVLTVDETRGSGDGRRVALPVAIIKAAHPRGLPPVIFLHGGPGGGAVSGLARLKPDSWEATADQDWIVFDQRGGRLAAPGLDCSSLALNDAGPDSEATVGALKACAARYAASGADLSRYNAVEVAHDVQDLRQALHLQTVDLFGVSYGTRIALEVVRTAPEGVRAVVLDSMWPPEAKWAENGAAPVARAVRQILALCAADLACAKDKPDLEARTDALTRRWLAQPITFKGHAYPVDDFAQYLMDAAYDGEMARALPADLQKFTAGDLAPLAAYDAERSTYMELQHLTHLCKEQFPFESRAATVRNAGSDPLAQALARTLVRYFDTCTGVPVGPADPAQARPVQSALPILVINAGIDPGCPPELARAALTHLPHGQFVLVPDATHGVTRYDPCAASIGRAFYRDPSRPADTACLKTQPQRFTFPQG